MTGLWDTLLKIPELPKIEITLIGVLVVALLAVVTHCIIRLMRRRRFRERYDIKITRKYKIKRRRNCSEPNSFILKYPFWEYSKKNGTCDQRYKNNRLIYEFSELYLDEFWVLTKSPIDLVELVNILRAKGAKIRLCKEEIRKRETILRKKRDRSCAQSIDNIIQQFVSRPSGFEEYCADLYRRQGYSAQTTQKTCDGGYDVVAVKDREKTLIECKCYGRKNSVGRPAIQKLVGANGTIHANHLTFITTSYFSRTAVEYAESVAVNLIDGSALLKLSNSLFDCNPTDVTATIEEITLSPSDLESYYPGDYFN